MGLFVVVVVVLLFLVLVFMTVFVFDPSNFYSADAFIHSLSSVIHIYLFVVSLPPRYVHDSGCGWCISIISIGLYDLPSIS